MSRCVIIFCLMKNGSYAHTCCVELRGQPRFQDTLSSTWERGFEMS